MIKNNWLILAIAASGEGLSGGDRIFIEFAKKWQKKVDLKIVVWEEGYLMCQKQNLNSSKHLKFAVLALKKWTKYGFFLSYILRIFGAINWALRVNPQKFSVVYSASEFWMDSFPAVILKLRNPKIKWVASWYQTAPNPLMGFSYTHDKKRYRGKALLYWLVQFPVKFLIRMLADLVLVNNEIEKQSFPLLTKKNKVQIVFGAVDTKRIKKYQSKFIKFSKKYDAVFQGRFHPQKGVEELVMIWRLVCKEKPSARLVMIGDGPLYEKVSWLIRQNQLTRNIELKGYVFDGDEKYRIFSQSKIVVHPSLFDSGGMASSEAMAFGLPTVGFDLQSYDSYYPVGMIKVPINNLNQFAKKCLGLLNNPQVRLNIGLEAKNFILKNRSWDKISVDIFEKIVKQF